MAGYNSGLSALTTLVTVAVLLAGVSFLTSGAIIVTDLVTFLLYINNFVEPVKTDELYRDVPKWIFWI